MKTRPKKYKQVASGEYLLRSKDKDVAGRQDIFEIYHKNPFGNKYTLKSLLTGLTLEVDGNQDIVKYEIFKIIKGDE